MKLFIEKAQSFVPAGSLAEVAKQTAPCNELLESGKGPGNDFLGWVHLPSSITPEFIAELNATAKVLQENCDAVVVAGIGGSYLGAKCAIEALEELGIAQDIFLVGIAERLEEILIPGDPNPLFFDKNSASLRILMHIRDEAHRFGITHHRARRTKSEVQSELRSIPGIGEATETKLLRRFRSVARLKKASQEEIAAVVGPSLAAKLVVALGTSDTDS